jgi:L-amino acid N-acyltransferase YncA
MSLSARPARLEDAPTITEIYNEGIEDRIATFETEPKPQIEKFRELARELETDDDEARFDERLKKLANAKPKPPKAEPKAP